MAGNDTDRQWEQWGLRDPYFGVLSQPQYRSGAIARNREQFFASGRTHIDGIMRDRKRLYPAGNSRRALDFGCGVGRLAIPLAEHFERLFAVDISEAMLQETACNCAEFGVTNVTTALFDSELSNLPGSFDFVHSLIVLQHLPLSRGLHIIAALISRLSPAGVAALHVPIESGRNWAKQAVYTIKSRVPGSRYAFNLLQGKDLHEPFMQVNPYPLNSIVRVYRNAGLSDIWFQAIDEEPLGVICWASKAP